MGAITLNKKKRKQKRQMTKDFKRHERLVNEMRKQRGRIPPGLAYTQRAFIKQYAAFCKKAAQRFKNLSNGQH